MSSFEQEYYEAERFWEGAAIQDENNLDRIAKTISMIPADAGSLADIGCGNGVFVNRLAKEKPSMTIVGVDRSEAALKYVQTEKMHGDIGAIPFDDNSFDCITCLEVIEHLPVT